MDDQNTSEQQKSDEQKPGDSPTQAQPEPIATAEPSVTATPAATTGATPKKRRFLASKKSKIIAGCVAGVVVIIATLIAVPLTRYTIFGLFIKKDVTVMVQDSSTHRVVSSASVSINGQMVTTDGKGKATLKAVPVGDKTITVKKTYYKNASVKLRVPILSAPATANVQMTATGRQVPIKVVNKITNQPLAKAQLLVSGSTATTNDGGQADIVLPADKTTLSGTLKLNGYNDATVTVQITDQTDPRNTFALVPSGKVYFLSDRTGKLNVMKSNLDGSDQQVALAGTGQESSTATVLLASRDWKYLALQATRDSAQAKLYLIDTTNNDKLTVIDSGGDFSPVGWYNNYFMYQVTRAGNVTDPKHYAIKSFNASTGQIGLLDESNAVGDQNNGAFQEFGSPYILNGLLAYVSYWQTNNTDISLLQGKTANLITVKPDGSGKQTVKSFDESGHRYTVLVASLYEPQGLYLRYVTDTSPAVYMKYEDGTVTPTTAVNDNNFYNAYPTYLVSPSGQKTFWSEVRDGKNTLLIGDNEGKNPKQVTTPTNDYAPYGWFSDNYLLVSKGGSELYILPTTTTGTVQPLKVTDYHKPSVSFAGYGYGYGGGL